MVIMGTSFKIAVVRHCRTLLLVGVSAVILIFVYQTNLVLPTFNRFLIQSYQDQNGSVQPKYKTSTFSSIYSKQKILPLLENLGIGNKQDTGNKHHKFSLNFQHRDQALVDTTAQTRKINQYSPQEITPGYISDNNSPSLPNYTSKWMNETVHDTGDRRFLVFRYLGRFGNIMFIYASCYSLALKYNRTLVLSKTDKIYQPFVNIPTPWIRHVRPCKGKVVTFTQERPRYYERLNVSETNASCVRIDGFLQSWRYFEDYFDDIRNQFTWKYFIRKRALQTIETLKSQTWPDTPFSNITTVGIHVRRGDYVTHKRPMADRAYFDSAKEYFLKNFSNILFIVTTSPNKNDRDWCVDNIQNGSGVTVIAGSKSKFVDMALLSMTDHLIISTGTFGWWAGFLNKGTVLHFDWIPDNHSRFNRDDYILPHWIGIKAVNVVYNNESVYQTVQL